MASASTVQAAAKAAAKAAKAEEEKLEKLGPTTKQLFEAIQQMFDRHWENLISDSPSLWARVYELYLNEPGPRLTDEKGVRGTVLLTWAGFGAMVDEDRKSRCCSKRARMQNVTPMVYMHLASMVPDSNAEARQAAATYDPENQVAVTMWCQDPSYAQVRVLSKDMRKDMNRTHPGFFPDRETLPDHRPVTTILGSSDFLPVAADASGKLYATPDVEKFIDGKLRMVPSGVCDPKSRVLKCRAASCLVTAQLKCCQRCRTVRYCSVTCQRADWPLHKPLCVRYKPEPTS